MNKYINLLISLSCLAVLISFATGNKLFQDKTGINSNNFTFSKKIKKTKKFDIPQLFSEYHSMIRTREGDLKPAYKPNQKLNELRTAIRRSEKLFRDKPQEKLDWIERGPGNVGGRTRGLMVDPYDETHKTWFAGSVAGGIWKTTDMGESWRNMTPFLPNLATTCLAYSQANPDIIYAGTGEGFMNLDAVNGDGIFKSTDHGETWNQLQSTVSFQSINRIVVDPKNANLVLCCANDMNISGVQDQRYFRARNSTIQRSTNGGLSWLQVYEAGENRIQQIVANPNDFNIQYATINGIGVIKSTNAGYTWFDAFEGLGEGSRFEMAIAPTNPDKLYLSVENGSKSDFYISEDAGENWYFVNDTKRNNSWLSSQGWYDNCIAVHPYDENTIFVGGVNIFKISMQSGMDSVYKILKINKTNIDSFMVFSDIGLPFSDGGIGTAEDLWEEKLLDNDEYSTVEIRFGSNRKQKAHRLIMTSENEYRYVDFVDVPFDVQDLDNYRQLAISFVDINMNGKFDLLEGEYPEGILIHAVRYNIDPDDSIKNNEKYKAAYVIAPLLKDGATWDPDNIPSSKIKIEWGKIYTKKRNTVAVTDGYGQFGNPNHNGIVHVDQHNITMIPVNEANGDYWILIGNDGGVAYSTNEGKNWIETDHNGYNTSQFYGCDKKPGANQYIGGTQDNGTWLSPNNVDAEALTQYKAVIGGDGFETVWHYRDIMKIIGTSQFNTIRRSTDGGISWHYIGSEITDGYGTGGPFVTKIAKSLTDPDLIFAVGKSGVWRSENFGNSWSLIPIPDSLWRSGGYYSNAQVDISIADPQVVWAGINMSSKGKLQLSTDGGLSFAPVNNYDPVPMGRITGLETHPLDKNTAYALFSFAKAPKILKTTDLGQTWKDISGFDDDSVSKTGFPDVAVYSMVVMPYNTDIIWVGTEIGLFESTDNGESWHYTDNGLPPVAIWQMKIVDDQVVLATHGRGIWSVTLPELEGYKPPDVTLAPSLSALGESPCGKLALRTNIRSEYDSTKVFLKLPVEDKYNEIMKFKDLNMSETDLMAPFDIDSQIVVSVYIASYKDDHEYKTGNYSVTLYPLDELVMNHYIDFKEVSANFGGWGFNIDSIPGFDTYALQSPHRYKNRTTIMSILLTPVIVADTLCNFKYNDIAIIEPGDSGTLYGDAYFYDYVVVEATRNGLDWIPLAPGYDARFDPDWLSVYYGQSTLSKDMFRAHEINLLDYFNKRDTILIRFRLYADAGANGWGWAIDNIDIQRNGYLDVNDYIKIHNEFYIKRLFPVPFSDELNIEFFATASGYINLEVYNSRGDKINNLVDGRVSEGTHIIKWQPINSSDAVYFIRMKKGNIVDTRKVVLIK
jgi:photosystem II stability/assembly factor-like uncharacterized protein